MRQGSAMDGIGRGRRSRTWRVFGAIGALGFAGSVYAQTGVTIPAGSDLWTTVHGGGQTFQDFSGSPIPADFFRPGSSPFSGSVEFEGVPLGDTRIGNDVDTVIERQEDAVLAGPGSETTISVQLVVLNLRSTQPISVLIDGVETLWNVTVMSYQGGTPTPPGTMTIRQTSETGGTFDSILPVVPIFTFFNVDNLQEAVILNGEDLDATFDFQANGVPWLLNKGDCEVQTLGVTLSLSSFPGVRIAPTSSNFFAGLTVPQGGSECKWVLTLEETQLARHGVLPPRLSVGEDADSDGLRDDCDNCPDLPNPLQEDADHDCVGDVCDNCADTSNANQADENGDGVGDVCEEEPPVDDGNGGGEIPTSGRNCFANFGALSAIFLGLVALRTPRLRVRRP